MQSQLLKSLTNRLILTAFIVGNIFLNMHYKEWVLRMWSIYILFSISITRRFNSKSSRFLCTNGEAKWVVDEASLQKVTHWTLPCYCWSKAREVETILVCGIFNYSTWKFFKKADFRQLDQLYFDTTVKVLVQLLTFQYMYTYIYT